MEFTGLKGNYKIRKNNGLESIMPYRVISDVLIRRKYETVYAGWYLVRIEGTKNLLRVHDPREDNNQIEGFTVFSEDEPGVLTPRF